MPCFFPNPAFTSETSLSSKGKPLVHILPRLSNPLLLSNLKASGKLLHVPCGQCIGCRLEYSRQWAVRIMHESKLQLDNCFITLTFNDESLFKRENPASLDKREFQLFMKRLRFHFSDTPIRFFHCGEYGSLTQRPHYHACLFNINFPDRKLYKKVGDHYLYTSKILSQLWPFGFSSVGTLTFESAAYVARYITKKVSGKNSFAHYCKFDSDTGEIDSYRLPEYVTMSRRKGIGHGWFDKFALTDVYASNKDFINLRGLKMKPPKYYDTQYDLIDPSQLALFKEQRKARAITHESDNTPDRLDVAHQLQLMRAKLLPRPLERYTEQNNENVHDL